MNAPATFPDHNWHEESGIVECHNCEGHGTQPNRPWLQNGDPDCWEVECPYCEGAGIYACEVCGFAVEIPGYDCLACDMVRDIPANLLTNETADALAAAIKAAIEAARIVPVRRAA